MLVMQEGAYTVEIEDTHGLKNPQPPRYTVQLVPDLTPKVELRHPQDGLEVDEMGSLPVRYDVEDDFGLQDAALVYFGAGAAEQRVPLHSGHFAKRQEQETFTWDLNQWPLPAVETVQVYVEVYDNDTISGPKKGVSPTITLKLRSREQEHQELQSLQKDVAEEVLALLADHLELSDRCGNGVSNRPQGSQPQSAILLLALGHARAGLGAGLGDRRVVRRRERGKPSIVMVPAAEADGASAATDARCEGSGERHGSQTPVNHASILRVPADDGQAATTTRPGATSTTRGATSRVDSRAQRAMSGSRPVPSSSRALCESRSAASGAA